MKKLCAVFMIGMFMVSLAGCNATKGMGKDLENTGKNIQEGVDKNQ